MPEHEPLNITDKDATRSAKTTEPRSDDAAAASEPMDLQRLPESDRQAPPPGRQRTGDPPAPRRPTP